jgi:hypothetical protein
VGSINNEFGSRDSAGRIINDPFPTPFASGGFDLDAIGVINQNPQGIQNNTLSNLKVYPNKLSIGERITISNIKTDINTSLYSYNGECIRKEYIDSSLDKTYLGTENLKAGLYFLRLEDSKSTRTCKLLIY